MSIIKADLDEIVFRTRNKVYGAYQLRKNFGRTIMLAFLFCGGALTLLLASPVIMRILNSVDNTVEVKKETEVVLAEAPALEEEKITPPPDVPPPPPPQRETVQFTPPEVVEDEKADPETTITPPEPEDDKQNVGTSTQEGTGDDGPTYNFDDAGKGTGEAAPVVEANPDPNKFVKVDAQPQASNMDAFRKSLVYPELARSAGVSGKVVLKVLIDQSGTPIDHRVQKTPHPSLTEEAVKKVYNLRFSPALQNGKPIKFWVVVPVDFSL